MVDSRGPFMVSVFSILHFDFSDLWPRVNAHNPLLMEEVSKFSEGHRPRALRCRKLCQIDSVKEVSILIDG